MATVTTAEPARCWWLPRRWQTDPAAQRLDVWLAEVRVWLAAHPFGLCDAQLDDVVQVLAEFIVDVLLGGAVGPVRASVDVDERGRVHLEVDAARPRRVLRRGALIARDRILTALTACWGTDQTRPDRRRMWAIVAGPRRPDETDQPQGAA